MGLVYTPYDSQAATTQKKIEELVLYSKEWRLELLLDCDANSHHIGWGSSNINSREESLHKFIMGTGLVILNRGYESIFMDSRRQEVIDITICSEEVAGLGTGEYRRTVRIGPQD